MRLFGRTSKQVDSAFTLSLLILLLLVDILSRVRSFLPQLKEANEKLKQEVQSNPTKYDIETVEEEKPYIEMVCNDLQRYNCSVVDFILF